MNTRSLFLLALATLALGGCAPTAERPSLRPVLVKAGEPAAPGQPVSLQGRFLGGPSNSSVIFRADENGIGGTRTADSDVVSWTPSTIVVKVPAGTTPGGGFVFVDVAGVLSNGLPFSVGQ